MVDVLLKDASWRSENATILCEQNTIKSEDFKFGRRQSPEVVPGCLDVLIDQNRIAVGIDDDEVRRAGRGFIRLLRKLDTLNL